MPKAGSSSIQAWLERNSSKLESDFEVCVLAARIDPRLSPARSVQLVPHKSGTVNSGGLIHLYVRPHTDKDALTLNFFEQLEARAARNRVVVVSAEALAQPFWKLDRRFLRGFEDLSRRHLVRVAYYVRPQHTALEAAWRQWGFRTGEAPSEYLAHRSKQLHYFDTYSAVREHAPGVSFEPRPFRSDLLGPGGPVGDFVSRFLDIDESALPSPSDWTNRGLPLDVVNVLRSLPPSLLWSSLHSNRRLNALKRALACVDIPESVEARRSRAVLQSFCHEAFEDGNQRLIAALGWEAAAFVPLVSAEGLTAPADLSSLDELWRADVAKLRRAITRAARSTPVAQRLRSATGSPLRAVRRRLRRAASG